MLDDGGHGRDARIARDQAVGNIVLEGHTKLHLARTDHGLGAVLGRLDDLDLEPLVLEEALGLGDVDARVVGVGRPVEGEGDLVGIIRCGSRAGGRAGCRGGGGAAAACEHGGTGGEAGAGEEVTTGEVELLHD